MILLCTFQQDMWLQVQDQAILHWRVGQYLSTDYPGETTEDTLRKYFSKFGEVIDATLVIDPETKMFRGFGYVVFGDTNAADAAKVVLNQENGGDRGGNQGGGGNGGFGRAGYRHNWDGFHSSPQYGESEMLYGGYGYGYSGDDGFGSPPR